MSTNSRFDCDLYVITATATGQKLDTGTGNERAACERARDNLTPALRQLLTPHSHYAFDVQVR